MAKNRVYAGIDVGTDKICTVIAVFNDDTGDTNVVGVAATPSRGLRKSQIVDLDEAINAITDSVEASERMAGFNLNHAYVSVSGSHIASQNSKGVVAVSEPQGEIRPTDVERVIEAARAIALPSARDIIHVIPRDYTVDAQGGIKDPVGMTGVRLEAEAHLITGAATALKNLNKCINELGINTQGQVFAGLASASAVLSETEKELGVVMADIGAGTTSLAVYVEGSLAYTGVIPVGARNITNDLAIGMRINLTSAEAIKVHLSKTQNLPAVSPNAKSADVVKARKDYDTLDLKALGVSEDLSTASRKALVDGIIRPRLNELFGLIYDQLKEQDLLKVVPAGIVLTGGGADTVGLIDTAKRTLSLPARVGLPKGLKGLVDELHSPGFATASGLILYAQKHDAGIPYSSSRPSLSAKLPKINFRPLYEKTIHLIKKLIP